MSNEAQRFLEADVAAERERVTREQQESAEAVARLRERHAAALDYVPPRQLPPGSAESYAYKRWSPRRNRWREVFEFDERACASLSCGRPI